MLFLLVQLLCGVRHLTMSACAAGLRAALPARPEAGEEGDTAGEEEEEEEDVDAVGEAFDAAHTLGELSLLDPDAQDRDTGNLTTTKCREKFVQGNVGW